MIDQKILDALKQPGNRLIVVVRPKFTPPEASESAMRSRFEGLGYIDSPVIGNNDGAVFVKSFHFPHVTKAYWLDGEVFIPAGRIK